MKPGHTNQPLTLRYALKVPLYRHFFLFLERRELHARCNAGKNGCGAISMVSYKSKRGQRGNFFAEQALFSLTGTIYCAKRLCKPQYELKSSGKEERLRL